MRRMIGVFLIAGLSLSAAAAIRAEDAPRRSRGARDAYAFVIDENTLNGSISVRDLDSIMRRFPRRYLWLRRNGRDYVLRDREKLAHAERLFDASDPERRSIEAERRSVEAREKALDRELDRLEDARDADEDGGEVEEASRSALEARRYALEQESRSLDEKERALDRRSDALDREAETKLWMLVDPWIADGSAQPLERR